MEVIILATRISGTDGVSLEAVHWKEILERMGHRVTFVAGQLDRAGICVPELHFQWPKVVEIHDRVIRGKKNYSDIEADIFEIAGRIEGQLRQIFHNKKSKVDLLIVPNALSIPMHLPLSVAITRTIEEFNIPTLARHHDFWWERERFLNSSMFPFFKQWFPPNLPNLKHTVINSISQKELKKRTGIDSEVVWDSFDFDSKVNQIDSYSKHWRKDFGIESDDIVFLQPTRIVPRKRIELSIELVKKLKNPRAVLVIAGHAGDEGREYEREIRRLAMSSKIRFLTVGEYVNSNRKLIRTNGQNKHKRHRIYTLWDCFVNADFVTYPTVVEGFGNQFVEAVYFNKPVIVTPYKVFKKDIAPLGFNIIAMPDKVTKEVVKKVNNLIENPNEIDDIVKTNFEIGKRYFSYDWVEKKLQKIINEMGLLRK